MTNVRDVNTPDAVDREARSIKAFLKYEEGEGRKTTVRIEWGTKEAMEKVTEMQIQKVLNVIKHVEAALLNILEDKAADLKRLSRELLEKAKGSGYLAPKATLTKLSEYIGGITEQEAEKLGRTIKECLEEIKAIFPEQDPIVVLNAFLKWKFGG